MHVNPSAAEKDAGITFLYRDRGGGGLGTAGPGTPSEDFQMSMILLYIEQRQAYTGMFTGKSAGAGMGLECLAWQLLLLP